MPGDQTWLKLFPRLFMRRDGASSFYVILSHSFNLFPFRLVELKDLVEKSVNSTFSLILLQVKDNIRVTYIFKLLPVNFCMLLKILLFFGLSPVLILKVYFFQIDKEISSYALAYLELWNFLLQLAVTCLLWEKKICWFQSSDDQLLNWFSCKLFCLLLILQN